MTENFTLKQQLEAKAKTLVQITRENCQKLKAYCGFCVADCEYEDTPTYKGKFLTVDEAFTVELQNRKKWLTQKRHEARLPHEVAAIDKLLKELE